MARDSLAGAEIPKENTRAARAKTSKGRAVVPPALAGLNIQPRVRDYLAAAVTGGRLSHAYLFVGAPGSGKTEAALALAQCIVCPTGGCGTCDECIRVARRSHPDVRVIAPESTTGYLIDQVREIIDDAPLAPVRGRAKVYILTDAGLLRGRSANALLKTIEEPPADVSFILCARTSEAVLPTIVSRCQEVPFRVVSPRAAAKAVEMRLGANETEARVALAVAGTPDRAVGFLTSPERRRVRRLMVRTLSELEADDSWDVISSADALVAAVWEALGWKDFKRSAKNRSAARVESIDDSKLNPFERELKSRTAGRLDYLSAGSIKQIEKAVKRELTARERSGMMEALAAAEALLRDVLMRSEGIDRPLTNADNEDVVDRMVAQTTTSGAVRALEAVSMAGDDIAHNVTPQLAIEVMLLRIKEALTCPPSYR